MFQFMYIFFDSNIYINKYLHLYIFYETRVYIKSKFIIRFMIKEKLNFKYSRHI